MKNLFNEFYNGIITENPVFRILLGLCATLAVTTTLINGLGMGIATTFVLVCSNIIISSIRNITPSKIRIPIYVLIIATFTTIVDLVMAAYTPALSKALGIFIPLIVVNCLILGRAEAFASKNGISVSFLDGVTKGIGFTLTLMLIGLIREYLGKEILIMILPPGAFIVVGLLIAGMNLWELSINNKAAATDSCCVPKHSQG